VRREDDGPGTDSARSRRTESVLDALDAVEERLDPSPARRGQRIADALTVLMLVGAVMVLGLPLARPSLLAGLLAGAAGVTRLARHLRLRRLITARDRLLEGLESPD